MQNYIIFNKQNKVFISKSYREDEKKQNLRIITCNSENLKSQNFSTFLQDTAEEDVLIVADGPDTSEVFQKVIQGLYFVEAAGGIVLNERKDVLFMYRNGYWDLPKGHREQGEEIIKTAEREVLEECGMKELTVGEYLASSYHVYTMHGRREIKQTYWYKMFCSSQETLTPQKEEGIRQLKWVPQSELNAILQKSYPNLQQLFRNIEL